MAKFTLLQLPTELLDLIIGKLDYGDILSLRLTCRMFHHYTSPVLFKYLSLNLHLKKDCNFLKAETDIIPQFVHDLDLESTVWWVPEAGQRYEGGVSIMPQLALFLQKAQNLYSLTWKHRSDDSHNPHMKGVMLALASIPSVREVTINIDNQKENDPFPELLRLHNLKSLVVRYKDFRYKHGLVRYIESSVRSALAASPGLEKLGICVPDGSACAQLDDIICNSSNCLAQETATSSLKELHIEGVFIRLEPHIRRIFQNLRHLTLTRGSWEPSAYDGGGSMTGIAWKAIWDALYDVGCRDNLWLESLATEGLQPRLAIEAFLAYLQSHPGLKKLVIRDPPRTHALMHANVHPVYYGDSISYEYGGEWNIFPPDIPAETQYQADLQAAWKRERLDNAQRAKTFWCNIIPRFAHSLQELRVTPGTESPWSYGPDASQGIRKCRLLNTLAINISVSTIDPGWAQERIAKITMVDDDPGILARWGRYRSQIEALQNSIVILAVDLGELPHLARVEVDLAVECPRPGKGTIYPQLKRNLGRFVPWAGYPHVLLGDDALIKLI